MEKGRRVWEDIPSRPRSRLRNACSGTKLATARIRLRSLSADDVQWVLQEHLPVPVGLCVGSDIHALGETLIPTCYVVLHDSVLYVTAGRSQPGREEHRFLQDPLDAIGT